MSRRIAVLGAGANGSCIAADLVAAGTDVTVFDPWALHVETMRSEGLRIRFPDRELHVRVRANHIGDLAKAKPPFDIVLLCMKAYDTRWAAELIKPHLAPEGMLIGVQNAMTADTIVDVVGTARTVGCAIELSSEMFTPGLVRRNVTNAKTWIGLGNLSPVTEARLPELAQLLGIVGRTEIKRDILAAKWTKLVVNAMCLGPPAMVGLTVLDAIELPGMRDLMIRIGNEAMRAGHEMGHRIEPIFGLGEADLAGSNNPAEKLFDKLVGDIGPGRGRNTVLQDLLKGRASEVGLINGRVVQELAKRGAAAPANASVVEIVRRIEAGEIEPKPDNLKPALAHAADGGRNT